MDTWLHMCIIAYKPIIIKRICVCYLKELINLHFYDILNRKDLTNDWLHLKNNNT